MTEQLIWPDDGSHTLKLFSIATSRPVMRLNSRMGYTAVTFSELPRTRI